MTAPAYIVPTGHTFSAWSVPDTMLAEDLTLDATLTTNSYIVAFVDKDGTTVLDTQTVEYGATYTATEISAPVDDTYATVFDANGGTVDPAKAKISKGGTLKDKLPTPAWEDHIFAGWYTNKTEETQVTEDTKFTKNTKNLRPLGYVRCRCAYRTCRLAPF